MSLILSTVKVIETKVPAVTDVLIYIESGPGLGFISCATMRI